MDKLHLQNENIEYTTKQKISNFFYHYKWHVVGVCFVVFIILWVVISSFGQQGEEAYIGYIGEYGYSHDERAEISGKMSEAVYVDFDGDGKCEIDFRSYHFYSDSQLEEMAKIELEPGQDIQYHPNLNAKNYENFSIELENGDTYLWFVSKEVYEMMDKSTLMPAADILGYTHAAEVNEYALDCSKLPFALRTTREIAYNTYLVFRANRAYSSIMGGEQADIALENAKTLYKAVAEYKG